MENSPLFLAHQNDRRAENHVRYKRFDEAVICHQKASELLLQAMKLTTVNKALESLKLQHDYHIKQKDIVRVKKIQFEIQKKIIDYRKQKMTLEKKASLNSERKEQDLQWAIFRTMEEADSLLGMLVMRDDELLETEGSTKSESEVIIGKKIPKDDCTVIEELRTLNTQLRSLITQLLSQLDASERQVETLRARLRAYEDDYPNPLPELPPLEMPQFDFSTVPSDMFPEITKNENS